MSATTPGPSASQSPIGSDGGAHDRRGTVVSRAVSILCALSNLLALAGIALRILTHMPGNHWGLDHRLLWAIPLGSGLWLGAAASRRVLRIGRLWWTVLILAALCAITIFAADHWNLLVEYETWLRRGMPDFGQVTRP